MNHFCARTNRAWRRRRTARFTTQGSKLLLHPHDGRVSGLTPSYMTASLLRRTGLELSLNLLDSPGVHLALMADYVKTTLKGIRSLHPLKPKISCNLWPIGHDTTVFSQLRMGSRITEGKPSVQHANFKPPGKTSSTEIRICVLLRGFADVCGRFAYDLRVGFFSVQAQKTRYSRNNACTARKVESSLESGCSGQTWRIVNELLTWSAFSKLLVKLVKCCLP